MAKRVVGPIEQHVEKAVLAIAGIGLIAVIAMYLVTSPNQIEIGGQMVSPTTIDQVLFNRAGEVRQRIDTTPPPEMEFEPLAEPSPTSSPRVPRLAPTCRSSIRRSTSRKWTPWFKSFGLMHRK